MKSSPRIFLSTFALAFLALLSSNAFSEDLAVTYDEFKGKLSFDLSPIKPQGALVTTYADVVEEAAPPVITIYAEREEDPELEEMMKDPLFRRLFPMPQMPREDRVTGSGVIISPDGYILTNNHVVENSKDIEVLVNFSNTNYDAQVVVADPKSDVAVIKIKGKNLPHAIIGDSSKLRVGDVTLAIGNPFGLSQTVTQGIVSALGRSTSEVSNLVDYASFIQTDASINRGNSGGALVDAQGRLIGINTAIQGGMGGGNVGIGFAIPINMALDIVDRLLTGGGVVRRGFLGVRLQELNRDLAEGLGWKKNYGVAIAQVLPNTPAAKAGLEHNDIIMGYEGLEAQNPDVLRLAISNTPPNQEVTFDVYRGGKEIKVKLQLAELPDDPTAMLTPGVVPPATKKGFIDGVEIVDMTEELRGELGIDEAEQGVIVESVEPGSAAEDAGIRAGQVIIEVNQKKVNTVDEAIAAMKDFDGKVLLVRVSVQGSMSTLAVRVRGEE